MKKPTRNSFANFTANRAAILIFSLYFVIGLVIVKDYGIGIDEVTEHGTSIINYNYVMGKGMLASKSERVKNTVSNYRNLMEYKDRFYGTALQQVPVLIEHLYNFELSSQDIFLIRHAFTFLNYFTACIFFYLILRRRFGNTFIPLLGILLYILYPRLFGESFYNIKDILFFSWYVISVYFALRWLEDERNSWILPTAATLAIATNTRILGISVLLLACVFAIAIGIRKKLSFGQAIQKPLMLMVLTFACYIVITPFTWENPLKNTIDIFFHFMDYPWNGTHLYMGEMITREVPWHYIPVWMGLTVPLFYIAMFFVGMVRKHVHLFDVFFIALFFCTLLGFIGLHISMYSGWRHAYSIYASFLYVAVIGLEHSFVFFKNKHIMLRRGFVCVVAACMVYLFAWIAVNHPHQYAYFNIIGKQFAEKNFILDEADVSFTALIRQVLAKDKRPKIHIATGSFGVFSKAAIFTDAEQKRIVLSSYDAEDVAKADYYIQDTRRPYKNRTAPPGFTRQSAITVDGMEISILYRRISSF
jgi:hypothetical protein